METSSDLRRRLSYAEKQNLELINQRNRDMSHYEKEIMKLRLELERGEALRRGLENDLSIVQKEANLQMYSAEDELFNVKAKLMELQALNDRHQQRAAETEQMYQNAQQQWIAEQQRFSREADEIRKIYHTELAVLIKEKAERERAVQEMNAALQSVHRKLREMETEHVGCSERLRHQANQLEFKTDQQEKLIKELEKATAKTRRLVESSEAARAAHLECKYTSEMMQLRIRELEEAFNVKKGDNREPLPVLDNMKKSFTQSANAHEKEKRVLQSQLSVSTPQDKVVTEVVATAEPPPRQENAQTVFSQALEEGPTKELGILLSLYQCMADGHVLVKKPEVTLEGLSWTEFCALLHENVQGLIINFHKANERIAYLENICHQKTDTVRDLQQNYEEAYRKVTEQLATQEHFWQKEKKFLEMQYSNLLEEAQARAKECENTAQKNRRKMSGLEKSYERLTQENTNMKNTLANIQKERSSLLAACALLGGALFPLYSRLCAMSSQRDLLQDVVNHQELVNQKVRTIIRTLPTKVEVSPDEATQRQRRAKGLVFVFRRGVIAVLTVNRLKALARASCSLFIWSKGLRGSLGIQVCVGESRGRRNVSRFEEQRVDCVEALDWLTSTNLHAAIISSISELQDVLKKPDPNSWLSGHSLISAARNSFAKLMDSLNVMMEVVQANQCSHFSLLERDSLMQRLANGLQRAISQALEVGLKDRLTSTENISMLQLDVLELSQDLLAAKAQSRSLFLQLEDLKLACDKFQKEAEEAHRLREQLNALQQRMATQGNIHEELNNALQREQEARWLLQQHEQRLQELSFRLQVDTNADTDQNQDADVLVTNLSEAMEELRKRDRVLNHQKRLLKYMEQDRQRLQANAVGLEGALQAATREKEFVVNHMRAVEATLKGVKDYISASGAVAAMTLLPRLQLETVSEEALRLMPEVAAFQAVLTTFKDIYQLVASRIETLARGAQPPWVRFASQGASAPREEFHQPPISLQAANTRQRPLQVHFASQANIIPGEVISSPQQEPLRIRFVPQALSREGSFAAYLAPQRITLSGEDSLPVGFAAESINLSVNESLPVNLTPQASSSPREEPLPNSFAPHGLSTPVALEGDAFGPEPGNFTFMLESEPDRRDASGGQALRFGPGASSNAMRYRTFVVPGTNTPAHVTPSGSAAEPPKDVPPNVSPRRAFTVSAASIPSVVIPSSSAAEPPKDIPPNVSPPKSFTVSAASIPSVVIPSSSAAEPPKDILPNVSPCRAFTVSAASIPSVVKPSSSGAEPPKDISPNVTPPKSFTVSAASIPSVVKPSSSGAEPPKDVSPNVTPPKAFNMSETHTPSDVTLSRSGTGSLTDVFFDTTPYRTYSVSGPKTPFNVTLSRTGPGLLMDVPSHAVANRTYPLTNIPSGGTPNRTVIGLPTNIPSPVVPNRAYSITDITSSGRPNRADSGFSNNASFSFRQLEADTSSLSGSSNHNTLSSMRRNDGI